ncbi:MAG: DUF4268 domain-containing protein [Bacteroidaceae bacterium]|nr:DUF4268 domain-containing protein [Bacteroidaceae bacterium]
MQETWKRFVYPLIEDKKMDVEEDTYHRHIENQLMLLDWEPWKGEVIHKQSLRIGNRNRMEPDILVARDGEYQFVIEVKRPGNTQIKKEVTQLESYMRQLRLDVGIYIGEHIEVFYDRPNTSHVLSVFKLTIDLEEKRGSRFVDLFSKENFSKDEIVNFCKERIKEIERQNNLNKIKENLIADAQTQIAESLRPYLLDKYGSSFSEEEIRGMLATMHFTASADGGQEEPTAVVPKPQPAPKSNLIKCFLSRNADAQGLFNPADQSLTVLKGSRINPVHLDKISSAGRKKRDILFAKFTEVKNGERIVREDVCFDSPSGAAQFCVGGSSNGWSQWKDETGHELNAYRDSGGVEVPSSDSTKVRSKKIIDSHTIQLDFWTRFSEKLQATGEIASLQSPRPQYWYDVRIGRSGIRLSNVCNTQQDFVGVKLYIRKPVVEKYYPALVARQKEINEALGSEPEWDANPTAQDKTIALFHKTDLSDPQNVEEALDWMVRQTVVFYEVFSKEVEGL